MIRLTRFFFLLSCLCLYIIPAQAQQEQQPATDTIAPFRKYPAMPAFNLLLPDSSTLFNTYTIKKGQPSVLILFSPDCSHCEQLTKMILDNMQAFRHVNVVMGSPLPLYQIKEFMVKTGLDKQKHIVVGHDPTFFFWSFFRADTVPFIVIYDQQKQLVTSISKLKKIEELLDILKPLK